MKISTLGRHVREGIKSVFRNGWMSFASISVIAISLFILGAFVILTLNVNHLSKTVEEQVEISVYLDVVESEEQINVIQTEIATIPEVSSITFVPKDEGLETLSEGMGELDLTEYFGESNPLPDKFTLKANKPENVDIVVSKVEAINDKFEMMPIEQVDYGKKTVEQLLAFTSGIRTVSIAIVAGLAFTAMFFISNTIKLTIISRNREISIMKLVGATNGFIRWPFFIEGFMLGLIGSIIPTGVLLYGYWKLIDFEESTVFGVTQWEYLPLNQLTFQLIFLLCSIGIIIGVWGSIISMRKFLRV
ncbi:permease-like cell division protein FtsX [Longirhabdus pacifica]|uniref:permease-like cell division protein FtsX n=1 Tax=Longirhabdus pacifica TaxID=2305227 RepID=UPI0010090FAF|nr:permease-like cell division protein FtsX [Longirhabdus pacifica]